MLYIFDNILPAVYIKTASYVEKVLERCPSKNSELPQAMAR